MTKIRLKKTYLWGGQNAVRVWGKIAVFLVPSIFLLGIPGSPSRPLSKKILGFQPKTMGFC